MTGVPTQGGWATDDDPLDLAAVAADDAAVEALRARSPEGLGLAAGDDVALLLVRELLRDVGAEPVPGARSGAPALRVVDGHGAPARSCRALRSGAVVAALAAGVLSLGGAAAAAGLAPADGPLRGVGEAVRAAAGAVVAAVTPPEAAEEQAPAAARPPLPEPAATTATTARSATTATTATTARSAPGAAAAVARAASAERAVTSLLDSAARQLAEGRPGPAALMLDTAERRLPEVPTAAAAALRERLAALRAEVAAATVSAQPAADDPGRSRGSEPAAEPGRGRPVDPPSGPESTPDRPTAKEPRAPASKAVPTSKGRSVPKPPVPAGPASTR